MPPLAYKLVQANGCAIKRSTADSISDNSEQNNKSIDKHITPDCYRPNGGGGCYASRRFGLKAHVTYSSYVSVQSLVSMCDTFLLGIPLRPLASHLYLSQPQKA